MKLRLRTIFKFKRVEEKQQSEPGRSSQKEGKRSRKECCSGSQRRKGISGGCGERELRECLGWCEKNGGGLQEISVSSLQALQEVTAPLPASSPSSVK